MAGRIRSIKPEWIEDERFNACSDAAIRLAHVFYALVDDDGRCKITVRGLGLAGWKFCDAVTDKTGHAQGAIAELVKCRWLVSYVAKDEQHWCIRNFAIHQVINKYKPSKLPPPPDEPCHAPANTVVVPSEYRTPPETARVVGVDLDQGSGSGSGMDQGVDPLVTAPKSPTPPEARAPKPIDRFAQSLTMAPKPPPDMVGQDDVAAAFSELRVEAKRGRYTNPGNRDGERLQRIADEANAHGSDRDSRIAALRVCISAYLASDQRDKTYPIAFLANDPGAYVALGGVVTESARASPQSAAKAKRDAAEKAVRDARLHRDSVQGTEAFSEASRAHGEAQRNLAKANAELEALEAAR